MVPGDLKNYIECEIMDRYQIANILKSTDETKYQFRGCYMQVIISLSFITLKGIAYPRLILQ